MTRGVPPATTTPPPARSIRARSAGSSGAWSRVSRAAANGGARREGEGGGGDAAAAEVRPRSRRGRARERARVTHVRDPDVAAAHQRGDDGRSAGGARREKRFVEFRYRLAHRALDDLVRELDAAAAASSRRRRRRRLAELRVDALVERRSRELGRVRAVVAVVHRGEPQRWSVVARRRRRRRRRRHHRASRGVFLAPAAAERYRVRARRRGDKSRPRARVARRARVVAVGRETHERRDVEDERDDAREERDDERGSIRRPRRGGGSSGRHRERRGARARDLSLKAKRSRSLSKKNSSARLKAKKTAKTFRHWGFPGDSSA